MPTLDNNTKITFGAIIAMTSVLLALGGAALHTNTRIAKFEQKLEDDGAMIRKIDSDYVSRETITKEFEYIKEDLREIKELVR